MPANPNFSVKIDLDSACDIRRALQDRLAALTGRPMLELTMDEQAEVGRIEALLRLEFGGL